MSTIKKRPSLKDELGDAEAPFDPDFEQRFREKVRTALDKDKRGALKYRDLDAVARDFGYDEH